VQLDGSGSTDPQKLTLTFLWSLLQAPAGSKAVLNATNVTTPSFVADLTGSYTVSLVVSDGAYSSPLATAIITAGPCGDNGPTVGSITFSQGTSIQTTEFAAPSVDGGTGDGGVVTDGGNEDAGTTSDGGTDVDAGPAADAGHADAGHSDAGTTQADAGSAETLFAEAAPILLKAAVEDLDTEPGTCTPAIPAVFTYQWSLQAPEGSAATLSSATAAAPTFVPDLAGVYLAALVVTDLNGHASPIESTTVTVSNCGEHKPVVTFVSSSVKASVNGVTVGTTAPQLDTPVTLTAAAFSADNGVDPTTGVNCDPSGLIQKTVTVNWTFLSLPFGSKATLDVPPVVTGGGSPSEPVSSLAFFSPDQPGSYVVQLSGVDSSGLKSTTAPVITITVAGCTGNQPPVVAAIAGFNEAGSPLPVGAGGNETDTIGDSVQFRPTVTDADNTGSCTPEQTFTYAWTLLSLPSASHTSLNDPTTAEPGLLLDAPGTFVLQLVVTDSVGVVSLPATISVTASASSSACGNRPPTIAPLQTTAVNVPWNAVAQIQANDQLLAANPTCTGSCVALFNTNDPDDNVCVTGLSLSYAWSFTSLPAGSHAAFFNAAIQNPSFVPDVANGEYVVQLVTTDSRGLSATATAVLHSENGGNPPVVQFSSALVAGEGNLTFQAGIGNAPPTLTGGEVGQAVTLNLGACIGTTAQLTDADNTTGSICKNDYGPETFTYAWTLESAPTGSVAQLVDAASLTPTLVPDQEGTYVVQVVVTSSVGLSSAPATVELTVGCGTSLTPVLTDISQLPATATAGVGEQLSVTVSNAGAEQTALCGTPDVFTYAWSFTSIPAGSQAVFVDPTAQAPSFTPDVANGAWNVQVVVTDIQGRSATATTVVSTGAAGAGGGPTITKVAANAILNTYNGALTATTTANPSVTWKGTGAVSAGSASFQLGEPITFTASATDSTTGQSLTYSWSLAGLPAGSSAVLNSSGDTASLTPDVPSASAAANDYVVALTVTDTAGQATSAQFGLTTSSCGSFQPVVATANGSVTNPGVIDLPSQPITFTGLAPTTITDENVTSCFPAQFRLASPPAYTYKWTLAKTPAGSAAVLENTDLAVSSLVPDMTGPYAATLVVTDATGQQSSANPAVSGSGGVFSTTVTGNCGGAAPTVLIGATDCTGSTNTSCTGPTQTASSGTAPYCSGNGNCLQETNSITVTPGDQWLLGSLTAPANFSCLSSDTWASMTYSWAIEASPSGFAASQLQNATTAGATFRANTAGTYVVSLTVTNELGKSASSSLTITVP
jgi:hypothetical protein